jgi:GAF domain-containing protein
MGPVPFNEADRLAKLESLVARIRDNMAVFQPIAAQAKAIFRVPIALVSVLDTDRQVFLGNCGIAGPDAPRDQTFCNVTILKPELTVVTNTTLDRRFAAHPFVTGAPRLRFYAGAPITFPVNLNIGTVCLADVRPRTFSNSDRMILSHLAHLVTLEIKRLPEATRDLGQLRLLGRTDPDAQQWDV